MMAFSAAASIVTAWSVVACVDSVKFTGCRLAERDTDRLDRLRREADTADGHPIPVAHFEADNRIAAIRAAVGADGEAGRAIHDLDLRVIDALTGRIDDLTTDVAGGGLRHKSCRARRESG